MLNIFKVFLSHLKFLCWEFSIQISTYFLNGLFCLLISHFLSSLYILEIYPLSDMRLGKIFSYSIGCFFVLFIVPFALQKLFSIMRSRFLISSFSAHMVGVLFREFFLVPVCLRSGWVSWSCRGPCWNLWPMLPLKAMWISMVCAAT